MTNVFYNQFTPAPQVGEIYNNQVIVEIECLGEKYPEEFEYKLTLERPCQCGSGQPWVSCSEASQYCG